VADTLPEDDHLAPDGRVMEILSEHTCQGWLEGYLLTGRHGLCNTYEAFVHIVDSMFNQHAKWLKVTNGEIPWRRPIASLNYLLSSHVWRQDHNGFSHQDPGFIDHVVNKKADVIRVYFPPDANSLLSVTDHCLRSRNYINVIVAGKRPALQYVDMDAAIKHRTAGIGIWEWASNDKGAEPDVVMACCGDIPTLETLAAVDLLHRHVPELKIRVVNVVDLMGLQPREEHPHGLSDRDFDALFTTDKPIIFAYHGYPWLIHRLTYRRTNHDHLHVRGYKEEGTTRRRSIWWCVTIWIVSIWCRTSSIACLSLATSRLMPSKRYAISSSSTRNTSASTAMICRRSAIGSGPPHETACREGPEGQPCSLSVDPMGTSFCV
jgi:xylulose-5-phosphate/fructose-6-phosphate phosphoketolase